MSLPGGGTVQRLPEFVERITSVTAPLYDLPFDQIREVAPRVLAELLPGTHLSIQDQHAAGTEIRRGPITLEDLGPAWAEHYFGPPEPLWFLAHGYPGGELAAVTLSFYFDRLLHALGTAGHVEELARQARRDWLTGLLRLATLERELQAPDRRDRLLGLVSLQAAGAETPLQKGERDLRIRSFGRSLRALLTEDEHAFHLGGGRIALLVSQREHARFDAFLTRELGPGPRVWVGLDEARGVEVLRLAEARLAYSRSGDSKWGTADTPPREDEPGIRLHPVTVSSGSTTTQRLAEALMRDWHFRKPVRLIFDIPLGYAMDVLPENPGASLVVTGPASSGYLRDLQDLDPDGLVLEPPSLNQLRTLLERIADGGRVYSGPILEDHSLLPREREVWRLAARGCDNEEIAGNLGISPKTVANYISTLQEKLELGSRAALVLAYWGVSRD